MSTLRIRPEAVILDEIATRAYDVAGDMLKVQSIQKKWRDDFPGAAVNTDKWVSQVGTGGSLAVSGSNLTIGSGTTASAVTGVVSVETFTIPFRLSVGISLSQRIANQSFVIELVSVNSETGVPDESNIARVIFDGTTATQAKYSVVNVDSTPLVSAASTFPTTATPANYEIELFADESWFHGGAMDSTTARANSYRRHQNIPDPNGIYKIRLRWINGGTAPASNSNAVLAYVACQDYSELTTEITSGRGSTSAGQALSVVVAGAVDTELPTAAAMADATANPTVPIAGGAALLFNGATWDRQRANFNTTTGDTGAKTATGNGATQTNFNARGAILTFVLGTVSGSSPTCVFKVQGSGDGGTTWYDIPGAATASLTATGNTVLAVFPGATVATNAAASYPLPRTWRVVWTIGGTTPSFTITAIHVAYIN